jgi:hypothetical protein
MNVLSANQTDLKIKAIIFIGIVILSGLPMWLSSYTQYLNHLWITGCSVLVCAIAAGIIAFKTAYKKAGITLYMALANQAALLIKIVLDCIPDPSNHNLAPFEMVLLFIADFVVIGIIVIICRLVKNS